jgi:two-component system, chemotaxis family, CheB/CheR fusion protein
MLLNARRIDHMQLILLAIEDVTERRRERELLVRELSHRVKNVFAVVQALATQTDGHARSVEAFRAAFLGRLQAMARAHGCRSPR